MKATAAALASGWERFWHRDGSPAEVAAVRVLLAGTALWVVLSRFDLPASMLDLPPELWRGVTPERRLRFLMIAGGDVERGLWALLHAALVAALLGLRPRLSCLLSGLLLYHFAPFESILRNGNPYLRGLTIPALGLSVLGFAACHGGAPRPQCRWPVALVQVFVAQIYLFAAVAKLETTGVAWIDGENIRGYLLLFAQALGEQPEASLAAAVASSPLACSLAAWGAILFELSFPLALLSARVRWVLVPVAIVFHVANSLLFRIFFPGVALPLVLLDWQAVRERLRRPPS